MTPPPVDHYQPDQYTVMVVDDTPSNLEVIQEILHDEGYRVVVFPHGEDALKGAAANPPHIVLLDIMMPGMSGFEVCARLKADADLQEIPVLFLTALTGVEHLVEGFDAGGVDYITKPIEPREMLVRVKTHVMLRQREMELKRVYEKLQEMETLRDSLVHATVHDLRSPLTVVMSVLGMLSREKLDPDLQEAVESGLDMARHMTSMVATVLDVSRMESGEITLQKAPVDVVTLLRRALGRGAPGGGNRTFTLNATEETLPVACDQLLVERVVQNLLGNAIRHTDRETGTVAITVEDGPAQLAVTVTDNGRGIPDEYHQVIFEKFGQVRAEHYTSGLGLFFCRLVMDAHGGKIGVESAPDKGASFTFALPRLAAAPDAVATEAIAPEAAAPEAIAPDSAGIV